MPRVPDGPLADNGRGDSSAAALASQLVDQVGEPGFVVAIDDALGLQLLVAVHAHIQGPLDPKAEAPLGVVELPARKAQVRDDSVQRRAAPDRLCDFAVAAVIKRHVFSKLLKALAASGKRFPIAVDQHQPPPFETA